MVVIWNNIHPSIVTARAQLFSFYQLIIYLPQPFFLFSTATMQLSIFQNVLSTTRIQDELCWHRKSQTQVPPNRLFSDMSLQYAYEVSTSVLCLEIKLFFIFFSKSKLQLKKFPSYYYSQIMSQNTATCSTSAYNCWSKKCFLERTASITSASFKV